MVTYKYDKLNRLIRENNKALNKTFIFDYDDNSNIISKETYDYTLDDNLENEDVIYYNHDKDLLKSYNGKDVLYDSCGNIISYDNNELEYKCNRLSKFNDITFKYNSNGYRIDHHYPNDHSPTHVHISGDDGMTRVDINGNPIQGDRPMTPGEKKAFWKLIDKIIEALKPWMK